MALTLAGWSLTGVLAIVLIVAGIGLLVVYALRRGLHDRELDGTDAALDTAGPPPGSSEQATSSAARRDGSRAMGATGATILVLGLVLGVIAASGGWGTPEAAGPGTAPQDCAQAWNGCPQATVAP